MTTMKNTVIATALGLGVAMTGCSSKTDDSKKVQDVISETQEKCSYFQNMVGIQADDFGKEKTSFNGWNSVLYPIGVECSQATAGIIEAEGKFSFNRSESLKNTTTGHVKSADMDADKQVQDFSDYLVGQNTTDPRVRSTYNPQSMTNISIRNGDIYAAASPEGKKDNGDKGLVLGSDKKANNEVARKRAELLLSTLEQQLGRVAQVDGFENISIKSGVQPLSDSEIGALERIALERFGNDGNRLIKMVELFNVTPEKLSLEEKKILDQIIGAKRFSELEISFEGTGINPQLDVSKWNYAVWLMYLVMLLGGGAMITKMIRKNNK